MDGAGISLIIILCLIVIVIICSTIKIVPQAHAYVIERLGTYQATWSVGLHMKMPVIDKVAKKVTLKEQVVDFAPQPVITKDNVTMRIDTVVFFQITDPKLFSYGVENPIMAIENLTATTLRNIIGDLELDQTLTSRETINTKMRATPAAIQDAMEKQMKAERERREQILRAEGEKKSAILIAEGNKQSVILEAEAEKASQILRAEAKKEATIKEAEGQAQAILAVQQANADGIRALNESMPTNQVITLKSLEAFTKAADGKATKIIIPSEIQGIAGLTSSIVEVAKSTEAAAISKQ